LNTINGASERNEIDFSRKLVYLNACGQSEEIERDRC
jgi:hypothetical protein